MSEVNFSGTTEPGETTDRITNEDYLWLGPKDGVNAVLILDGTSGTAGDFGSKEKKTGGRRYVEALGRSVKQELQENPEKDLENVLEKAISATWDHFAEEGVSERENYFSGDKEATIPTAETVPGAVGSLIRWSEDNLELLHIGDVETYVVKSKDEVEMFCNKVHQRFDDIRDEKIKELRKKGVENPSKSSKVEELVDFHRSAANKPGTYPNMSFNPLVVRKQGEKKSYNIENLEKVVLGTDGATARIKELFDLDNRELIEYLEKEGVEEAIRELRKKENSENLDKLKNSDDAALAVIEF